MKATGVVRRIDDLGRIVLPKELRRTMRIKEGESLEIFIDGSDKIILKKYSPVQNINEFVDEFVDSIYASNKKDIIISDNEKIVAASEGIKSLFLNKKISSKLEEIIKSRNTEVIKTKNFEVCENINIPHPIVIKPINVFGDITGCCIIVGSDEITDVEKSLAEFGGTFMSRYLEG